MNHKIKIKGANIELEQLPNGKFRKPPLAQKYSGYKYSISPLKQVVEEIMVFMKPCKTGSPLHDCLAYENGDKEITVSALNIDGNRVETNESTKRPTGLKVNTYSANKIRGFIAGSDNGRYPAQAFLTNTEDILDEQSGVLKSGDIKPYKTVANSEIYGGGKGYWKDGDKITSNWKSDTGGCSKILHKCPYETEEYDLFNYSPKVSKSERSKGLEFDSSGIVCYNISILGNNSNICEKNTIHEEKLAVLLVDTAQSAIRVTGESGTQEKDALLWNIVLFLKNTLEKYLTENGYTTKTEINWITELKTLNLLTLLLTKENISVAKNEKTDGINLVVNVADFFTNQNFIEQMGGLSDSVKSAVSKFQLSINAKEWQSGHPTLKPISLNEKILRLFKTPNPQKILIPFAGSGSEIIGAYKAGFEDIQGCEINEEYVKIAEARIKYYENIW